MQRPTLSTFRAQFPTEAMGICAADPNASSGCGTRACGGCCSNTRSGDSVMRHRMRTRRLTGLLLGTANTERRDMCDSLHKCRRHCSVGRRRPDFSDYMQLTSSAP